MSILFFLDGFEVYPNPFQDILTVQISSVEDSVIEVYSTSGKLVYEKSVAVSGLQDTSYNIDLSMLQSGIYMLSLKSKETSKTLKIVKL